MSENIEKQILRLVEEIEKEEKNLRRHLSWDEPEKVEECKQTIARKTKILDILTK